MGVKVKFWKGAWWVFVNHRGKRKAKRVGDRVTAMKLAQAIRERIARGDLQLGPSTEETLETYANGWLKGLTGNLRASTIAFYTDNLKRHVFPLLGRRPVGSVTRLTPRVERSIDSMRCNHLQPPRNQRLILLKQGSGVSPYE